jgi:hypothetical protein
VIDEPLGDAAFVKAIRKIAETLKQRQKNEIMRQRLENEINGKWNHKEAERER